MGGRKVALGILSSPLVTSTRPSWGFQRRLLGGLWTVLSPPVLRRDASSHVRRLSKWRREACACPGG